MLRKLTTSVFLLTAAMHSTAVPFDIPTGQRQLFLDNSDIAQTTNVQQTLHQPTKAGAVIQPNVSAGEITIQTRSAPVWDEQAKVFKMWTIPRLAPDQGVDRHDRAYVESADGTHWTTPVLGQVGYRGSTNNNLLGEPAPENAVYDPDDPDPARRYKGFLGGASRQPIVSPDGIHWMQLNVPSLPSGDESNLSYDRASHTFIATLKTGGPYGRSQAIWSSHDFNSWTNTNVVFSADALDQTRGVAQIQAQFTNPALQHPVSNDPAYYNVDVYNMGLFRYESRYIGMPAMYHATGPDGEGNTDGFMTVQLASSSDLKTFNRVADRGTFISPSPVGQGAYDLFQNLPPSAPVVQGDQLLFYYTGIKYRLDPPNSDPNEGAVCLATLRRDGFVSMDAGATQGTLLTKPFVLSGNELFVNVDAAGGSLGVTVLDSGGRPMASSETVVGDQLHAMLQWGSGDLASLVGQTVSLQFTFQEANLYSFWVVPEPSTSAMLLTGALITATVWWRRAMFRRMMLRWALGFLVSGATCSAILAAAPIDMPAGQRQLFLDNYCVAKADHLTKTMHQPEKKGAVIRPDWPGEIALQIRCAPVWDEKRQVYQIWLCPRLEPSKPGEELHVRGYAESKDGIHWTKPALGMIEYRGSKNNNLLGPLGPENLVFDPDDPDPDRRYKCLQHSGDHRQPIVSADGIHWNHAKGQSLPSGDESNLSYDPATRTFIVTLKTGGPHGRSHAIWTSQDFQTWTNTNVVFSADDLDQELGRRNIKARLAARNLQQPLYNNPADYNTDIYNVAVFRYEGLYLGLPAMYHATGKSKTENNTDGFMLVQLACSRDLRNWQRLGNRQPFIGPSPVGQGAYDLFQILPPSTPVVRGDELWFYYSGFKTRSTPNDEAHDDGAICLAVLRRDGFISLDAGDTPGTLLTKPFIVHGTELFLNSDATQGTVQVAVLNSNNESLAVSEPVTGDRPQASVRWKKGNVADLEGQTVRLRFTLQKAKLYSFWFDKPRRLGFYLHGAWKYNYPFAVRAWKRADYQNWFQLLKQFGYNTVMLWPCVEAAPMPLSSADREAVGAFRPIIEDAQKCGLETWLVACAVGSQPEIAAKPWRERSLYAHMQTVRLDKRQEAEAYLQHRTALLAILNNADAYVTIDGDPGSYPGAKPAEFINLLLNDRKTIDRVGTHPKAQKIIPWIWCGWGTKGVWQEPIEPFVTATLRALQQQMAEPWELLPGRSHEGSGNKRVNMGLIRQAGLVDRSTLFLYEAIEYEPAVPAAALQFADIRDYMRKEKDLLTRAKGCFGNSQTPILVIPNLYLFARCAQDANYLDQPDDRVLTDLATALGGSPELLIPAWTCLRLGLDRLPADLPARLRSAKLDAAAACLPGGAANYLNILAAQVDSRIRLLQATSRLAKTPPEAALAIADGTAALVDWWKLHRYVAGGEGDEPFRWNYTDQHPVLRAWCAMNVTDAQPVAESAVKEIVSRGVLTEPVAKRCVAELLKR